MVSATTQLKLTASDGKKYKTDVISQAGVESQGQVLDSLKDSPIQKECDAKIDQTLAEIQQILGIEINKEANE